MTRLAVLVGALAVGGEHLHVDVDGVGRASSAADGMNLDLRVAARGETVAATKDALDEALWALTAAVKKNAHVALNLGRLALREEFDWQSNGQRQKVGMVLEQDLRLRLQAPEPDAPLVVTDEPGTPAPAKPGGVLEQVLSVNATRAVISIEAFEPYVDNEAELEQRALAAATADCLAKAEAIRAVAAPEALLTITEVDASHRPRELAGPREGTLKTAFVTTDVFNERNVTLDRTVRCAFRAD